MPEVQEPGSGQEINLNHLEARGVKPDSFTLREAVKVFSDPALLQEFEKHRDEGGILALLAQNHPEGPIAGVDENTFQIIRAQAKLADELLDKLRRGELLAQGYDSRWRLESGPVNIPPDAWDFLRPDFRDSSAAGGVLSFAGVRVRKADPNPRYKEAALARPTGKALNVCREIVKNLLKGGYPYVNREALLHYVQETVKQTDPSLRVTNYTLRRVLSEFSLPESWKKRGPKSGKRSAE